MRRRNFIRPRPLHICVLTLLLSPALVARAQGCSICRDSTAGSAPQIRAGLRRAIPVLALPAIALFIGFFVVARRTDAWQRPETNAWNESKEPQSLDDDR